MPIPSMPDRFDELASRLAAEATTWPPRPDIIATWLRQVAKEEREACAEMARTYRDDDDRVAILRAVLTEIAASAPAVKFETIKALCEAALVQTE